MRPACEGNRDGPRIRLADCAGDAPHLPVRHPALLRLPLAPPARHPVAAAVPAGAPAPRPPCRTPLAFYRARPAAHSPVADRRTRLSALAEGLGGKDWA